MEKRCELIETCAFFNDRMKEFPGITDMYKRNYCLKDNSQCARYLVATKAGREFVPIDLYPNMLEKAEKIIQEHTGK